MFWLKQRPRDPKSLANNVYTCIAKETWGLASPYAFGCMCHNRKMGTFWPYHCFLIQIALCFHDSVIATKVLINSDSGCKKCGVKVINFTV